MQFIDLATQQKRIREKIDQNIKTVLDHGQYVMGPEIAEIEKRLAAYVGVKHAIGCSSGTDALLMALMAVCPMACFNIDVIWSMASFRFSGNYLCNGSHGLHAAIKPVAFG